MIKLQKDSTIYEAVSYRVFADYVEVVWGQYSNILTPDEWSKYTILSTESADEQNEN